MKYLAMICRGYVPGWGNRMNQDIVKFMLYFMPKGVKFNKQTAQTAIRHLHLAFKGMETDEIYDVLMAQLIRAIVKYDPKYTEKVKEVAEIIEHLPEQITIADINKHVEFDCNRHIRLLCRRGFLTSEAGQNKNQPGDPDHLKPQIKQWLKNYRELKARTGSG